MAVRHFADALISAATFPAAARGHGHLHLARRVAVLGGEDAVVAWDQRVEGGDAEVIGVGIRCDRAGRMDLRACQRLAAGARDLDAQAAGRRPRSATE
jgi:hypothetical protein